MRIHSSRLHNLKRAIACSHLGHNLFLCKVLGVCDEEEFWNSVEGSATLRDLVKYMIEGHTLSFMLGGYSFHNLTNCNMTLSISDPSVAASFLRGMQGGPKVYTIHNFVFILLLS